MTDEKTKKSRRELVEEYLDKVYSPEDQAKDAAEKQLRDQFERDQEAGREPFQH